MKKIPIFSLIVIAFSLFSCIPEVNAATGNLKKEKTDYYSYRTYGDKRFTEEFYLYSINGKTAYCIEPGVTEGDEYTSGTWQNINLSNEVKNKIMLISYYGYDYPGHQTLEYRAATQALIWTTIYDSIYENPSTAEFYTRIGGKGEKLSIDKERNEIKKLISTHTIRPKFNGETVSVPVGKSVVLKDENLVLDNYDVISTNGAEVKKENNTLIITPTKLDTVRITLSKRQVYNESYIIYFSPDKQSMYAVGNIDPVQAVVNIKGLGGKVEFKKYDQETIVAQGVATLKGAIYGIYDESDNLIQKLTTNNDGYAISNYLPYLGKYYLKEIVPSVGYELDESKYFFEINENNLLVSLNVKEEVIEREVEINKVYASDKTGEMIPESGIEFGFYNSNGELYKKVTTDKNGRAKLKLVFDTYIVKQLNTTPNYEKVEDFTITVDKSGEPFYYTLANSETKAKLKIVKVDSETGEKIKISGIKFKIFDINRNKYVKQTITYPTSKIITEFETNSEGEIITPHPLNNGKYYLEEVDQQITGYLWNKEKIYFEISDDSNFIYDDTFGKMIMIKYSNTKVKGKIELEKNGEEFTIENNKFYYKEKKLNSIEFEVYDLRDNLVGKITTNEEGYGCLNNLELGKYYLKEIKTAHDYVLDNEKHYFELKYKDQYTEEVVVKLNLKNFLKKGRLEFTKIDISTSESLSNTLIEIYTENNELIYSDKTNENGNLIINDLLYGKYYILEKEAPEGYYINENKIWFEIKEDGEIVEAIMSDEKIIDVPKTSLNDYSNFIWLFVIIIGASMIGYEIKKKEI